MTSQELREMFSNLYPDEANSRRVASDAALRLNHISFSGSAINFWQAIWQEAENSSKVEALLTIVRNDYRENQKLQSLINQYLSSLNQRLIEDSKLSSDTLPQSWQVYEQRGDEFRDNALSTHLLIERENYWSRAKEAYQVAIAQVQEHESIDKVRLYRKMTECLRKLGDVDLAEEKFLEPALRLIEHIHDQPKPNVEKAYLWLEQAYIVYKYEKWSELKTRSEDIIKVYGSDPTHGPQREVRFVVGSAYNLLAIVLQRLSKEMVRSNKTPQYCWEQAEYLLEGLESSEAKRILQDVKINSAVYWFDKGDCDVAIKKLEQIYHRYIADTKDAIDLLPAQRQILVKHNLAAAYLHKPEHLGRANKLIQENLVSAQELNDIEEWIPALQLQLKVIREQIDQADNSEKSNLLGKAEKLQKELNRAIKLNKRSGWDNDEDHLELHRLFLEIYLAARQMDKAREAFKKIEKWRSSDVNQADLLSTRALFFHVTGMLDRALFVLEEACQLYRDLGYLGMFIDMKTRLAEWHMQRQDLSKARELLREVYTDAEDLDCEDRINRIERLAAEVDAIQQYK